MDLILWRHAEAEDGTESIPDHKRRLTARGEKQARQMAQWLRPRLPRKTRILVSPAERTQQTAHALQLPYELEKRIGVGASPADLIKASGWPDHDSAVLLIGHQPTLGQLAARLLAGKEADWAVKKGAIWWLTHRVRGIKEQTTLRLVLPADVL